MTQFPSIEPFTSSVVDHEPSEKPSLKIKKEKKRKKS